MNVIHLEPGEYVAKRVDCADPLWGFVEGFLGGGVDLARGHLVRWAAGGGHCIIYTTFCNDVCIIFKVGEGGSGGRNVIERFRVEAMAIFVATDGEKKVVCDGRLVLLDWDGDTGSEGVWASEGEEGEDGEEDA